MMETKLMNSRTTEVPGNILVNSHWGGIAGTGGEGIFSSVSLANLSSWISSSSLKCLVQRGECVHPLVPA